MPIRPFRDLSIRHKLIAIIMATCAIVLMLGGAGLGARYVATAQKNMAERMTLLARVTGTNTAATVVFDDPASARDTLAALAAEPSITDARIYDRDGRLFARFTADGATRPVPLAPDADTLRVSSPIVLDSSTVGKVVVDADLRPLRLALLRDIGLLALIILAAGLLALPLALWLQRIVSQPIQGLARTMRQVSQRRDYDVQVDKHSNDEVGALIDGFNEMLRQISARDEQLRIAANAVENTGDAIMITDARLRIVSVNRAFGAMTGLARDEAVGASPLGLLSDRHAPGFYRQLWRRLSTTGQWDGELWARRRNGEVFPQRMMISEIRDKSGSRAHYVFVSNDISQQKRYEASLEHMAHHDALTQLPNRLLFEAELAEALRRAKRNGGRVALMFVDLDKFKAINDSLGHAAGDELLRTVAARLKGCVRESDLVARLGGDEFTVLLDGLHGAQDAALVAEKILAELGRPLLLAGQSLSISASIGIGCYPEDGLDASALTRSADAAMYVVKEQGRNGYRLYAAEAVA